MREYTVKQLAGLAGVSIRTLHHYDEIGLLAPRLRTAAGYRVYGETELLRLQQILFYRELGIPLNEIGRILDAPDFDPVIALENHRANLEVRLGRLHRLLKTVDDTLSRYAGENDMLTDKELYEGFSEETVARYRREARERYDGNLVEETERRMRRLSKTEWQAVKAEGDVVTRRLSALVNEPPGSANVQAVVAEHHAWLERNFYTASAELYDGLGQTYATNPEFREYYEKYATGMADFLSAAMRCYANGVLRRRA